MSGKSPLLTSRPQSRVRDRWFNTSSCGTLIFSESLTKQEFKDECDINIVLGRYQEVRPWQHPPTLRFGEFAEAPDFLGAQLLVKAAEDQFLSLPAKVRDRFQHSPARFLEFVHDPNNIAEARSLGIFLPEAPPPAPADPALKTP